MSVFMEVFKKCLRQQLQAHPAMQPRDVVKMCYQAACGAEHLLSDLDGAKRFFDKEFAAVAERDEPLFERISETVCRVNLGAWKRRGLPAEQLFQMFTGTVFQTDGKQRLTEYLAAAETVLLETGFPMDAWYGFLEEYKKDGLPAVRHSELYREREKPAYRIADAMYMERFPDE